MLVNLLDIHMKEAVKEKDISHKSRVASLCFNKLLELKRLHEFPPDKYGFIVIKDCFKPDVEVVKNLKLSLMRKGVSIRNNELLEEHTRRHVGLFNTMPLP